MDTRHRWVMLGAVALVTGGLVAAGTADTVRLRNGKSYEGRILSDQGRKVVLEFRRSGIRSKMTFDKRDIARLERGPVRASAPVPKPKPITPKPAKTTPTPTKPAAAAQTAANAPLLRVDLRYGLGRSGFFFPAQLSDENVAIDAGPRRRLFQLPLRYTVGDKPRHITRSSVAVRTGSGRAGQCLGIVVAPPDRSQPPSAAPTRPRFGFVPGADQPEPIQSPSANDPLWERVTPRLRDGVAYLECANTARPKPPRRPQPATPRGRRSGGSRRDRQRSGRSNPATPRRRSGPERRTLTGGVFLVYAIPEDARSIVCTIKSDPPIETVLAVDFLVELETNTNQRDPAALASMAVQIPGAAGPVAEVLVARLSQAGRSFNPNVDDTDDPVGAGLVAGLGHGAAAVRTAAWEVLASGRAVSAPTLQRIAASDNVLIYQSILAGTQAAIARAASALPSASRAPPPTNFRRDFDSNLVPSALPDSPVSPVVFTLLGAALQSPAAGNGSEALALILEEGTKQAVAALAGAAFLVQQTVLKQLDSLEDADLAGALLRTLLLSPDSRITQPLLAKTKRFPITIDSPDDPLLSAPARATDPAVQVALLDTLRALPLEPVFEGERIQAMLEQTIGAQADQRTQTAALALIARHWRPAVALLSLDGFGRAARQPPRPRTLEGMLYALATNPATAGPVVAKALATLATKGQGHVAARAIGSLAPPQRAAVIDDLVASATPDGYGVALLLGDALADEDADAARAAFDGIDKLLEQADPRQRLRLASAMKASADFVEALKRTDAGANSDLARVAKRVIADAASLEPSQREEFFARADVPSREAFLREVDYGRGENPAGVYRGTLYVDLRIPRPAAANANPRGTFRQDRVIFDIPIDLGVIRIVKADDELTLETGGHAVPANAEASRGAQRGIGMRASVTFDARPLLESVLARLPAAAAAITGDKTLGMAKLTLPPTTDPAAKLDYVLFGRWQSEIDWSAQRFTAPSGADTTAAPPVTLFKARIVLDRVSGAPAS